MHAGDDEQREAREVDAAPKVLRDPPHRERGQLDGDQQVQRDDAPRGRDRLPRRREGNEQRCESEVRVGVRDEAHQVNAREDERQPAEKAMDVGEPRGCRSTSEHACREHETDHDRQREQEPRDDSARSGHVPPQLGVRHAVTST